MTRTRLIFIVVLLLAVFQALLAARVGFSCGHGFGFYEGGG